MKKHVFSHFHPHSRAVRLLCMTFALLGLFSVFSLSVFAEANEAKSISLIGKGSLIVPADTATLNFNFDTRAKSAEEAAAQSDVLLAQVRQSCGDMGELTENNLCVVHAGHDFTASRYISLTLSDPEKVEEAEQKLRAIGVLCINNVYYSLSDSTPYEAEAVQKAVANAEAKAQLLGISYKVRRIEENDTIYYPSSGTPVPDKQVVVEARITVVFEK